MFDPGLFGRVFGLQGASQDQLKKMKEEALAARQAAQDNNLLASSKGVPPQAVKPTAQMSAAPKHYWDNSPDTTNAQMSAAPKTLVEQGIEVPGKIWNYFTGGNAQKDLNNFATTIDPTHQSIIGKSLYNATTPQPQVVQGKTPAQQSNNAADKALSKPIERVINKPTTPTPKTPSNTDNLKAGYGKPKTIPLPVTPEDEGQAVIVPLTEKDMESSGMVPVNNTIAPSMAQPQQIEGQVQTQVPSPQYDSKEAIIQNPIEAQKQAIAERQLMIDKYDPMIRRSLEGTLGRKLSDDEWELQKQGIIMPTKPWAIAHPVAAAIGNVLSGFGSANLGGGSTGSQIANGISNGFQNMGRNRVASQDSWGQYTDKYRQELAQGIERGRVYADVPGTNLNTQMSEGALQARASDMQNRTQQYNKDIEGYNSSQYAQGGKIQPGAPIDNTTQAAMLGQTLKKQGQSELDTQSGKLTGILNKLNGGQEISGEDLKGLSESQVTSILNMITPEARLKLQTAQRSAQQLDYSTDATKNSYLQDIISRKGANSPEARAMYQAIASGGTPEQQYKIYAELMGIQTRPKGKAATGSRFGTAPGTKGTAPAGGSGSLTPDQQKQSQNIYPGG